MNQLEESVRETLEHAEQYIILRYQLFKLKLLDKASSLGAAILNKILAYVSFVLFFFFGNITLGLYLGDKLGKTYYGFAILTIIYILLFLIARFILYKTCRKVILKYLARKFIKHGL